MTTDLHPEVDWGAHTPRWAGITTRTVLVDGRTVHALWHPGPDEGGGLPQLLVHGLGGNATNWLEVMVPLAERGPVLAVDLPGFGRTELHDRSDARLAPQRRFLTALVEALGWERLELHGNSMGGLLSVLLAASEPDRIASLVLVAPAMPAPRSLAALSPAVALRFAPFVSASFGARVMRRLWGRAPAEKVWLQTMELLVDDPEALPAELKDVSITNIGVAREHHWRAHGFAVAASDLVRHLFLRDEIDRAIEAVKAPTLVVWGTEDQLVSRLAVERTMERRPDWSRAVLGGIGHVPMVEAPEAHLDAIDAWRRL